MDSNERAKLESEWAKANQWGRALARKKAIATAVSSAVFGVILLVGFMIGLRGLICAVLVGIPAGMGVRKALWPRGQFS